MGTGSKSNTTTTPTPTHGDRLASGSHHRVVIIGAGFAGLGMAIQCQQQGISDWVLLEKADDVGGTWRDNHYPNCQCDVPSNLYSFSFALKPDWSRSFGWAEEIHQYLQQCTQDFGLNPGIRFDSEVTAAQWDDAGSCWRITTADGWHCTADVMVSGHGPLSAPAVPDIAGLDEFSGPVFHSAHWDHSVDLEGKKVAVIGTGASSVQIVPGIQPEVDELLVFQRSAPWVVPRPDRPVSERRKAIYRRFPALQRLVRQAIYWSRELLVVPMAYRPSLLGAGEAQARAHLARQVRDPELRAKLEPDYSMGCKRVLLSNDYYPALAADNTSLVDERIDKVGTGSILTADGVEHEVDVIVLATGFHVTDHPMADRVRGRDGRTLNEHWSESQSAYLGTSVTGFPNMFMIIGPNTGLGHTSMIVMMEAQFAYILGAFDHMRRTGTEVIEVRPQVQRSFNEELQQKLDGTVWASGCASWYLDDDGRNTTLWPDFTFRFRRRLARFDPGSYTQR
ncbi:MAG: NAD(P)/FAD-dependent oxidoreductase [Actinomycetia bacterium]|nr:NAD(P)/FAD-dependent oxidoreductase [Actinomycetes bacterium]